ncbi:MAG: WecB/TagA/CpsF family glycosyltransferase [Pirellulaceae bacterium]
MLDTADRPTASDKINILGVGVDPIDMNIAVKRIDQLIAADQSQYVCVTPIHSIMDCQADPNLRSIFNRAALVTPDGMPVVWICNWLGKHTTQRVYGPDLLLRVCASSQQSRHRHFFYGGADGVAEQLAVVLKERFPDMQIAGTCSPPFKQLSSEEDQEIVNQINAAKPDIVWVGLGAPKQEQWMADHIDSINGTLFIGIGAAFDFHTGRVRQAPYWMQRSGLEWLFRLGMEPKRLWRRYLVGNTRFLFKFFLQQTGLRTYTLG